MKKLMVLIIASLFLAGCGSKSSDNNEIRIGATPIPHAEILKEIKPVLKKAGYELVISEFTDYIKPNQALINDDLDANFFQHKPYMDEWAKKAKASESIKSVFAVHFEPLGIYSTHYKTLDEISDGDKIAIPNDPTNGGRALKLLEDNGILSLKKGSGVYASKNDIVTMEKEIEIVEMAAEACAKNIEDVAYAVVNGNNALLAKINDSVIVKEDKESEAAKTYANIIAVRSDLAKSSKVKALIKALNTKKVKAFIEEKYDGNVVPLVLNEEE